MPQVTFSAAIVWLGFVPMVIQQEKQLGTKRINPNLEKKAVDHDRRMFIASRLRCLKKR